MGIVTASRSGVWELLSKRYIVAMALTATMSMTYP